MSDIAVGFYEIIYGGTLFQSETKLLAKDRLTKKYRLANDLLAGDTMHSFNRIKGLTPIPDEFNNQPTCQTGWPDYLYRYYYQYHCLANFWVIPKKYGREILIKHAKGRRYTYEDDLDLFVNAIFTIQQDDEAIMKNYIKIFNSTKSSPDTTNTEDDKEKELDDKIREIHFLNAPKLSETICQLYKDKESKQLIDMFTIDIRERACEIAISDYCEALWEYFNKLDLI